MCEQFTSPEHFPDGGKSTTAVKGECHLDRLLTKAQDGLQAPQESPTRLRPGGRSRGFLR